MKKPNLRDFSLELTARSEGRKPSIIRKFFFCWLGYHRSHEYKSDGNVYNFCHDCGKSEQTQTAPIEEAIRQRPMTLTDDYIGHLISIHKSEPPDRKAMGMYWIETLVAMEACNVKSLEEWDSDRLSPEDRKQAYIKGQARIARVLFQMGSLSQSKATELGAFD